MARKKKSRGVPEVNASSMADIAFLLLVFFLVTTTIATDKGVTLTLPPFEEEPDKIEILDTDVLNVLINFRNELLVEGELAKVSSIKETTREFLDKAGSGDPEFPKSLQKAIVSMKAYPRYRLHYLLRSIGSGKSGLL